MKTKEIYDFRKNYTDYKKPCVFEGYKLAVLFDEKDEIKKLGGKWNQDLKSWSFNWSNISETDADEIETFLEARGGAESFDYQPQGEAASKKYICVNWSKSIPYLNRATINATFQQVAEA